MHPLDNAVWHALAGPQSTLGDDRNTPLARRYHPDVSLFAALDDSPTPDSWDALRDLVGPGNAAVLFREMVAIPEGWEVLAEIPALQMHPGGHFPAPDVDLLTLGVDDVPEMLDLVARTQPGPFSRRTIELGAYLGVRDGGRLVAMAGERLRPPGTSEISAVCVDPDHRRRGLAAALMRALVERIEAREEHPFLHVASDNTGAIRTYEALGFTVVRAPLAVVLTAPK